MKSMGWFTAITILLSKVTIEGCSVGSNIWLAEWSGVVNGTDATRDLYLGIYGAIGAGKAVLTLISSLMLAFGAMQSARVLHSSMLFNVLKAPMSFFDTTPLGRIVNRFSKDIYVIDEIIPMILSMFLGMVCSVISILVVICVSTPFFLIVIVPLAIVYVLTQVWISELQF